MISSVLALCAMAGYTASNSPLASSLIHFSSEIPVKAPAGWKTTRDQGATVMVPDDLTAGKIYTVVVTPLQTKAGTIDEVYETGKKMLEVAGTYTPAVAPQVKQSDGGWDYKFTIGTLEKDGKGLMAQIMALKKGEEGGVVVVLSDSVETMQKYADPFANMIGSLGGSAKPPLAPVVAAASGTVDLQYSVPAGWVESKKQGATVIEASKDEFYTKYRWTIVVMPSQPITASIREHFVDYWSALISANYESEIAPLPLMLRLGDGYICALDADNNAKHKSSGAKPRTLSVYLVAHGNRFVPILAITYGFETKLEEDLQRFIETARIPGSSNSKISMFAKSEVVGAWSEGSSSIASYVTSSGGYAGDASVYTGSTFTFQQDGSYHHTFIGISGNLHIKENDEGKWSIDDDELVLNQAKGIKRYSLLGYGQDQKAGRFLVLGTYSNVKAKLSFTNPRGMLQASWYKLK